MAMLLGVFVAITLVGWLAGSAVLARDSRSTADEDVKAAKALLTRFRNGEDSVLPALSAVVEHCREAHHRLDVQRIFDFYVGLSHADRLRGVEEQTEFQQIYDRVKKAGDEHLVGEDWKELREQVLEDLGVFIDRTIHEPDPAPAAYALGLRSTLKSQRLRTPNSLETESRVLWITSGTDDAERSIKLFTHCGMQLPQMDPLLSLAWLEWAQKRLTKAERLFSQVKSLARDARSVPYQARALTGLERIATERGDVQQRSRYLVEIAALGPDALTWDVVRDQGQFLLELGEPRLAAEWLAPHEPKERTELQDWHFLMYAVTSRAGMTDAARLHGEVLRKSPGAAQVGSAEWLAVAEMDLKEGRPAEVLRRLDELEQPSTDLRRCADIARLRGEAHYELGHYAEAANVLNEALRYSQEREDWSSDVDTHSQTGSVVGEVVGLESVALLASALNASGETLDAAAAIENWQSRSLRLGANTVQDITAQDIKSWAGRFESGLLTWVIGADRSVVVYVHPDGHATAAPLTIGRRQLENAVRRLREAAFDADSAKAYHYGDEIQSAILPQHVLSEIGTGNGKRILLCVHGALESMPADLLPLFRGDESSSVVPVTLPGLFGEPSEAGWTAKSGTSWCILGDPMVALPDDTVPGASRELEGVAKLHPGATVHTGPAFVRGNALTALKSNSCVHLASHLVSGERSSTSIDDSMSHAAILLSHGERLSIEDIRDASPKLDLAVLNACYTAGGEKVDAEPVQGIARAFLMSGTRNVLVTMWPIEDGAAAHFALAFHAGLNEGLSPSRAAIVARNELRSAGASPGEWAAFRVIGRD